MRVGWREYLKQRFRKPSKFFSVGLEIGAQDLHISVLKKRDGTFVWVKHASLLIADWQEQLKKFVSESDLANTPCHVAFSTTKYQLLQIDKPQVEEAELKQALTWAVKEQIPSQEEMVIDYIELPAQTSGTNKIDVVAIPKQDIETLCQGVNGAGLQLTSIGVAELATCDLVEVSEEAVMTLVQQAGFDMCLNIVKNGQLYFSRRLRGYENLSSFNLQEIQMGVSENLSIEIQRSMDYFESQLRQAPVKKILLGVESDILEEFADLMKQLTFMPVEPFNPQTLSTNDNGFIGRYLPSLGAAMAQAGEASKA